MPSLQPRNILITGGGSGLGRSLSHLLLAAGHSVIVTDRDLDALQETVDLAGEHRSRATVLLLDVTIDAHVDRLRDDPAVRAVDVLVNNAGLQHVAPLESFEPQKWDELIAVMLQGVFRVMRAMLPGMRTRGFGRIINIGSIHSLVASPFKSAYVAAKHGLLGLAKVVALETADTDITINTICPAYIRTPLVDAQIEAPAREHGIPEQQVVEQIMLKPMPKKSFITAEEVGAAVEFLMQDTARNITGQTIVIDGGWTIQ